MKAVVAILLSAALGVSTVASARPAVPIQRFLLVVGANAGGGDRPKLQYAISDAERFARVMTELGGVPQGNEVLLRQPKLKELVDALDALNARVVDARRVTDVRRIEVVVYYSGHADDQGLLLGGERYSYRALRDRLDQIPADVRIAVLDACASGAFTRLKGGKLRPPFLVDESADMRGHAFLTSSAATESAQESDRIRASYFTHYLVSGFRGAADLSGDGKVTLNEAYQFAFNETLGRTVDTRGGAQHPSYDINLSGSGDVVMTDVRQTTATIVLPEDLEGRIFVRNAARELVAEVYKPAGRRVELGVEPGEYDVRLERLKTSMAARTRVQDGSAVTITAKQFGPAATEPTRRRGDLPVSPYAVTGRHRVDLTFGGTHASKPRSDVLGAVARSNAFAALQYTKFVTEPLAITFAVSAGAPASTALNRGGDRSGSFLILAPAGVRWNPLAGRAPFSQIKPFVAATIGPVFGTETRKYYQAADVSTRTNTEMALGGGATGGIDFHFARVLSLTVSGGYNWMTGFNHPIGPFDDYGGAQFGFSVGLLFGKGR